MELIEDIKTRLQKYPAAKYECGANYIRVLPNSEKGFTVDLVASRNDFTVHYNGWHEDFDDEEAALNCFTFGLSTQCRLKEFRRWKVAFQWTAQYWDGAAWVEDSTTGLLLYPFWGGLEIRYLQNDLISNE
jgi:hypothetical protein